MNKAIFIRNPKCATISIRSAINRGNLPISFDEIETHQRALQWQQNLPDYRKRFVFSVCRNPYDRLLSGWLFICKRKLEKHKLILAKYGQNFDQFVLHLEKDFSMKLTDVDMVTWPQYKWLTDTNGNIIVNELGRFENLANWWEKLCKTNKWVHIPLPMVNRTKHGPWIDYYTPDMIKVVNEQYANDFRILNYDML